MVVCAGAVAMTAVGVTGCTSENLNSGQVATKSGQVATKPSVKSKKLDASNDGWQNIANNMRVRYGAVKLFTSGIWEGFTTFGIQSHDTFGRLAAKPDTSISSQETQDLKGDAIIYNCQNGKAHINWGTDVYGLVSANEDSRIQYRLDGKRYIFPAWGPDGRPLETTSLMLSRRKDGQQKHEYKGTEELGIGSMIHNDVEQQGKLNSALTKANKIEFSVHSEDAGRGFYSKWVLPTPIAEMNLQEVCKEMGATVLKVNTPQQESSQKDADAET